MLGWIDDLLARVDLQALAEQAGAHFRRAGNGARSTCPLHGGDNPQAFEVYTADDGRQRWRCHTSCGAGGDAGDFWRAWHKLPDTPQGRIDALRELAQWAGDPARLASPARCPSPTARPSTAAEHGPGPMEWQNAAHAAARLCMRVMDSPTGQPARDYLAGRGVTIETARRFRLGYNPRGRRLSEIAQWCVAHVPRYNVGDGRLVENEFTPVGDVDPYIPPGLVIPTFELGTYWALKIRLLPGHTFKCQNGDCRHELQAPGKCPHCGTDNRYAGVRGNRAALFGAETLAGRDMAILTEGEFDCMLLWPIAEALGVGVATLGSASAGLDPMTWGPFFWPLRRVLLAYDVDRAGQAGAARLLSMLGERAQRASVPARREGDKDITDYWRAGGDLREWLAGELAHVVDLERV